MTSWQRLLRLRRPAARDAAAASPRVVDALITGLRGETSLEQLLARNVRLTIDSGGAASLPAGVVTGRAPAAEALRDLLGRFAEWQPAPAAVNGSPGIVIASRGRVVGVLAMSVRRGHVAQLWVVVNPDKLAHWPVP